MEPLNIGIDLGSMALRVAYTAEGSGVVNLEHGSADSAGWLLCERSPSNPLGVSFPSLKSRLGAAARLWDDDGGPAPSQTLTEALARAKRDVEEQTGRPVAQAVICVPALYPTSQRAALHDAALAAGFSAVHLINDSVGAVTAHAASRPSPATVLVFGAGYHGFELGVVRVVKGHVRALAYEGGRVGGANLDQLVLKGFVDTVAADGLILGEDQWGASQWMELRAAAQTTKEAVGTVDEAVFPLAVVNPSKMIMRVSFPRRYFEEAVRKVFRPAVSLVEALLQKAGMDRADLDAVVLVGGTTRIPALQTLIAETVGRAPVVAPPTSLAVGAALHAAGLGSKPGPVLFETERVVDAEEAKAPPVDGIVLQATAAFTKAPTTGAGFRSEATLAANEIVSMPELPSPDVLKRWVARVIGAGEVERARVQLGELIRTAQAALDRLPDPHEHAALSPTSPAYRSQLALSNARSCLERRQFARAVSESHYAWQLGPDDPEVLDKMIDIHCQAAMVNGAPEQYEDAIRWLECALGHDESNARTRSLLAERHYRQAQELRRRGETEAALQITERCLRRDPDHPGAAELHRSLISE